MEVGKDLDDEDDISKMETGQMRQKLSACHKALGPAEREFDETGVYDPEVLELARNRHKQRRRRSGWQTQLCKEWTRIRQGTVLTKAVDFFVLNEDKFDVIHDVAKHHITQPSEARGFQLLHKSGW